MLTRDGVCYDLTKSPYSCVKNGVTFYFSSQKHLDKFQDRLKTNRDTINYSLTKRFGFSVDVSTLADVVLYKKVETRGFLIAVEEVEYKCLKSLKLGGAKVTLRNSKG